MSPLKKRTKKPLKPRIPGLGAGNVLYISDDFDDPLPDDWGKINEATLGYAHPTVVGWYASTTVYQRAEAVACSAAEILDTTIEDSQ